MRSFFHRLYILRDGQVEMWSKRKWIINIMSKVKYEEDVIQHQHKSAYTIHALYNDTHRRYTPYTICTNT